MDLWTMAYPTPSLYTYRVLETPSVRNPQVTRSGGIFEAQFSTNSGSTWRPLNGIEYQSLIEAYWAIKNVVSDEAKWKATFLAGNGFVPAAQVVHAYPPA